MCFVCAPLLTNIFPSIYHSVSSEGRLQYSEVRTFLQKQDSVIGVYRSITTSGNSTISLSGNHLIHAKKISNDKFTPM